MPKIVLCFFIMHHDKELRVSLGRIFRGRGISELLNMI